jgi:hypothetical protein
MKDETRPDEAEAHSETVLSLSLSHAKGGQVITDDGRPTSSGVILDAAEAARRRAAINQLREFGKGRVLGVPVKELIDEGRMRLVRKFLDKGH